MNRLADVALLLTISTLWSLAILCVKLTVAHLPPVTLGAARAILASLAILAFCLVARVPLRPAFRRSPTMVALALVGIVGLWTLLPDAERSIGSGLATLLSVVVPGAALVAIAVPPIRSRVPWFGWVGLCLGAAGLILAIGPERLLHERSTLVAVAVTVVGFAGFGVYCVMTERLTRGIAPAAAAGVSIGYAAVVMSILAMVLESPWRYRPDTREWLLLLAIGIPFTAIPNLLVFVLARRAGGVFVSLNGYTMPIFGLVLAFLVNDEVPVWTLYLGVPLVFLGMALVQTAQRRSRANGEEREKAPASTPTHTVQTGDD